MHLIAPMTFLYHLFHCCVKDRSSILLVRHRMTLSLRVVATGTPRLKKRCVGGPWAKSPPVMSKKPTGRLCSASLTGPSPRRALQARVVLTELCSPRAESR